GSVEQAVTFQASDPTGTDTRTVTPSPRPSPAGRNESVWESTCSQWPGMAGSKRGSREPSTADTGRANVRVSGASGEMRLPASGSATTLVRDPGTNHETRAGCESVSQGRTAAATVVVPAVARPDARIPSGTSLRRDPSLRSCPSPTATRLTGSTKLTVTALPRRGLRRVERMCAAGVTTVIVRFSWPPTSQPIQLG